MIVFRTLAKGHEYAAHIYAEIDSGVDISRPANGEIEEAELTNQERVSAVAA